MLNKLNYRRALSNDDHPVRRATGQCTRPDIVRTLHGRYNTLGRAARLQSASVCRRHAALRLLRTTMSQPQHLCWRCGHYVAQWMRSNRKDGVHVVRSAATSSSAASWPTDCSITLNHSGWVGPPPRRVSWQRYVNAHACHTASRLVLRRPTSTA